MSKTKEWLMSLSAIQAAAMRLEVQKQKEQTKQTDKQSKEDDEEQWWQK